MRFEEQKIKEDCEEMWYRLYNFHLLAAMNQSNVEQRLPFGSTRILTPLNRFKDALKLLKPEDFLFRMKDLSFLRFDEQILNRKLEPKQRLEPESKQRFKFVQQNGNSCETKEVEKMLKFDPSAILFFKESGEFLRSNITSNINGSVSNDKFQLGSILNQGCWLTSLNDLYILNNSSFVDVLPKVLNNKLRCLKYAEFVSQEGAELKRFGNEVEFISIDPKGTILMGRKQDLEFKMHLFVADKNGIMKFSSNLYQRTSNDSIYKQQVKLENGDLIVITRSKQDLDVKKIIETVLKCSLDQDLEEEILSCIDINMHPSAILVSKLHLIKDFDEAFSNNNHALSIKYVSHLDSKIGQLVSHSCPGQYGYTTRHSAIYREDYFIALHHDASKINRFSDTINYIIRKLGKSSNLGKRLEQEGEDCVLKRISDIQYFAYVLRLKSGKIVLGLGGGAKCVILSEKLNQVSVISVHEVPILIELKEIRPSDQVILLSPHFPPTDLIKEINAVNIQEWIKELLKKSSQVDFKSFKVSLVHFEFKNK